MIGECSVTGGDGYLLKRPQAAEDAEFLLAYRNWTLNTGKPCHKQPCPLPDGSTRPTPPPVDPPTTSHVQPPPGEKSTPPVGPSGGTPSKGYAEANDDSITCNASATGRTRRTGRPWRSWQHLENNETTFEEAIRSVRTIGRAAGLVDDIGTGDRTLANRIDHRRIDGDFRRFDDFDRFVLSTLKSETWGKSRNPISTSIKEARSRSSTAAENRSP